MKDSYIKIGLVGLNRGRTYLMNIGKVKEAKITAICDIDVEKAYSRAKEFGIPEDCVYSDYRKMLETDIDAVVFATPITLHAEHVIDALNAGKNVISEVICATSVEDCKRIVDAVKKSGKKYMMSENYCYIKPMLIIENMIKSGMLGEIYYSESEYLKDFQAYHPKFPNIGGWRQPTYFGRKGHPYITHSIGPLLHITGERIKKVTAIGAGHSFDMVADSTCGLLCETTSGGVVSLRSSFVSPRPDNFCYYSFQGSKGCFRAAQSTDDFHRVFIDNTCKPSEWKSIDEFSEYLPDKWRAIFGDEDSKLPCETETYALYDGGFAVMLRDFALCILDGGEPPIGILDAANWTATGILSGVSVENGGKTVEIPNME